MQDKLLSRNHRVYIVLAGISLAVLVLSAIAYWALSHQAAQAPQQSSLGPVPEVQITPPASMEELADKYPQLSGLLRDSTLDSIYKEFLVAYQEGGVEAARALAMERGLLNDRDEIVLTLVIDDAGNTAKVAAELERFGIVVAGTYQSMIDVGVPFAMIQEFAKADNLDAMFEQLTQLEHIIKLRLPIPIRTNRAAAAPAREVTQGITITGAEQWHRAGFTGKGVKVGILDQGFDGYKNLLGTSLPEGVTVKSFVLGSEVDASGSVHGTACAEIVHAMAPEAELYFAYYNGTQVGFGRAVDWLVEQGVDVISHSAASVVAPMDGTGNIARIVDKVVSEESIVWVNGTGNSATEHYRGTFTDSDGDGWHEFPDGQELMAVRPVMGELEVVLSWNDWQEVSHDFNLYLYDSRSNLIASSQDSQSGNRGDIPVEYIYLSNPGNQVYYAVIQAAGGDRPVTFDFFATDCEIGFPVPSYSLGSPSDARHSLSVGAYYWKDLVLEDFSSQGPTNDGRLKPELSAPDGVASDSYSPDVFYGTSAATPHVAGAAALVLSAFPDFTPQQVRDYLTANAVDMGVEGADNGYGYGGLQLPAPPSAEQPKEPTASIGITPTALAMVPVATPTLVEPEATGAFHAPTPQIVPVRTGQTSRAILFLLGSLMVIGGLGTVGGIGLFLLVRSLAGKPAPAPLLAPDYYVPVLSAKLVGDGISYDLRVGENSIGREMDNDIVIEGDNLVSRHHATIYWDGNLCRVTDLSSSNGTFVDGQRLLAHVPQEVRARQCLSLGPRTSFILQLPE